MGFSSFMVVLDPEQPVYFPGQAVTGYLRITATEEVACRNIKITIKGLAKVHWSEKSGKNRRHYRSEEQYFRQPVTVWSGEGTGNSMSPGDRKFPFSFILPREIPSSFISDFGKVIYQVKAEADRPWTLDESHKVFFSVNFMYNLNQDPLAVKPMRIQEEKTVCCCCCTQGPVEINMSSERTGYVSGENIIVNGDIVNNSSSTMEYTEIKLVQAITFITKSKKKVIERTVQRVYHPQLQGGRRDDWASVPLPIPALPASHLRHCNIITIDYAFVAVAKFGTCMKATGKAPIIIGAVPLQATYSNFLPQSAPVQYGGTTITTAPVSPYNPSAPSYPLSDPSVPPPVPPHQESVYRGSPPPYSATILPDEYRNVPPPSYASCVFGGQNNRGAMMDDAAEDSDAGAAEYAPRYLTYRTQM